MSVIDAVLLGIIQGLTEFLPVSSSGHLVLGQALLGIHVPGVVFEVVVHLATLCAVVWVYRRKILELAGGVFRGRPDAVRYVLMLILASIPAALVGLLLADSLVPLFDDPVLAAVMLLVTGTLVYTLKYTAPRATDDEPGPGQSVWIGIAQALAIVPGVSRSGATVAVGAWRGVEVIHVAEFSFLMSIPAILGAGLLRFGDFAGNGIHVGPLAAGFVAALVSGVLAIHLFIRMLSHATLYRFAYYCWLVGLTFLASLLFFPDLGG